MSARPEPPFPAPEGFVHVARPDAGWHLYGRWVEDGRVMHWIVVPADAAPGGAS